MTRTCSRCSQEQALTEFPRAVRVNENNQGYQGVCKACLRSRQAGESKRCRTCQEWKPAEAYNEGRSGGRENHCRECRNKMQRERYSGEHIPTGDSRGKLPDYDTLKRLILQDGLNYKQIADRYKVHDRRAVYRVVKGRAERRGEWPLLSPADVEARKLKARRHSLQPGNFRVASGLLIELIEIYLEVHSMTRTQLAHRAGVRPNYLHTMMSKAGPATILPAFALRLMEAIDEPVPDQLRELARRGYQPRPLPTPVRNAEIAAWPTDATADGEERVG